MRPPADEDVAVRENLDVALARCEQVAGMRVGAAERYGATLLVDVEHDRARDRVAVVEQADRSVRLPPGVVLPGEHRRRGEREVRPLASEAPHDLPGLAVELVDRVGVARGDEQVLVAVDGDRVQVHVVPIGAERPVGLLEGDVVEAVPLQQHPAAGDVDLLEHGVLDVAGRRSADRTQVVRHHQVGGQQRGAAVGQQELVQVAGAPVARVDCCERLVRESAIT